MLTIGGLAYDLPLRATLTAILALLCQKGGNGKGGAEELATV